MVFNGFVLLSFGKGEALCKSHRNDDFFKKIFRVMRIITFLVFVCSLQVSAGAYSQITLKGKDVPVSKLLRQIQDQSGYDLLVNYKLLEKTGTVSVDLRNVSLREALDKVLKDKGLSYTINDKTIVIKTTEGSVNTYPRPVLTAENTTR